MGISESEKKLLAAEKATDKKVTGTKRKKKLANPNSLAVKKKKTKSQPTIHPTPAEPVQNDPVVPTKKKNRRKKRPRKQAATQQQAESSAKTTAADSASNTESQ